LCSPVVNGSDGENGRRGQRHSGATGERHDRGGQARKAEQFQQHRGLPHGSVGYEWGTYTDPNTGQSVHVHTVDAAVGMGTTPNSKVPADVAERDREVMERELYEKALPDAKVSSPVAGYLYFPVPKPNKKAKYHLTYSGHAEPVDLTLP
jgi:hypothetical protein